MIKKRSVDHLLYVLCGLWCQHSADISAQLMMELFS